MHEENAQGLEQLVQLRGKLLQQLLVDALGGLSVAFVGQVSDLVDDEGGVTHLDIDERVDLVFFIAEFADPLLDLRQFFFD